MDKLANFKEFVKEHPSLISFVRNNEMTWQKFYELYDLYGPDHDTWNTYILPAATATVTAATAAKETSDIFGWLKNIDLDSLQENIGSIQRVVGVLQDLGGSKGESVKPEYKPRPLYKHFED